MGQADILALFLTVDLRSKSTITMFSPIKLYKEKAFIAQYKVRGLCKVFLFKVRKLPSYCWFSENCFRKVCWILSRVFGASFVMIVWCIYFLNMVCHINWLLNDETTFYSWDNLIFSWWIILCVTPIFMKNSRLQFSFLVMSLPGSGIG